MSWKSGVVDATLLALAASGMASADVRPDASASGGLSQRLFLAAKASPGMAQSDGTLYGIRRWRASTRESYFGIRFDGMLSCAYTVSAIFAEAGHTIGEKASVKGVDQALSTWPKITDMRKLRAGDIVFWKPWQRRVAGIRCPSNHWHVGVSTGGDKTVDNDWWSGMPREGTLSRICVRFAYARRPPD